MNIVVERKEDCMEKICMMEKVKEVFSDGTFVSLYQSKDNMVVTIDSCGENLIIINS